MKAMSTLKFRRCFKSSLNERMEPRSSIYDWLSRLYRNYPILLFSSSLHHTNRILIPCVPHWVHISISNFVHSKMYSLDTWYILVWKPCIMILQANHFDEIITKIISGKMRATELYVLRWRNPQFQHSSDFLN